MRKLGIWIEQVERGSDKRPATRGFALPTVLIASVVMLIVLLSALTAVSSVSVGIRNQYVDKIGRTAAKSGQAMAAACMKSNGGLITWTRLKPLRPNTNCNGDILTSCNLESTNPACYVLVSNTYRTTFEVSYTLGTGGVITSIDSTGFTRQVRKTSGQAISQVDNTIKVSIGQQSLAPNDALSGSVISDAGANESIAVAATVGRGSMITDFVAYVCGTRVADNVVMCRERSYYTTDDTFISDPLGTEPMKNVSVSVAVGKSNNSGNFLSYSCGVRVSDSIVVCSGSAYSDTNLSYPTDPFGSTPMKSISVAAEVGGSNNSYTYIGYVCGIRASDSIVSCIRASSSTASNAYASNPLGTTPMKSVSAAATVGGATNTNVYVGYICGVLVSSGAIECAGGTNSNPTDALNSNPLGTTPMKSISVAAAAGRSTNSNTFVSFVCGIRISDSAVNCFRSGSYDSGTAYLTDPLNSTPMKAVSNAAAVSSSNNINAYYGHVCGIRASDTVVKCFSRGLYDTDAAYPTNPLNTTSIKDFSGDSLYTYCGVSAANLASCTTSTASSPFGTNPMTTISVVKNKNATVCGIQVSNNQVACVALATSPFGSTAMKDVSVNTSNGVAICGVYKSNGVVACTTADTSNPFSSIQLSSIAVSVGTTGGYPRRICAIRVADSYGTCTASVTTSPFGSTTVTDLSVSTAGTANGQFVCGIAAGTLLATCATSITNAPFAGVKMLDVSVTTNSSGYVCGILAVSKEINCVPITNSPLGTSQVSSATGLATGILY